jgi:hypothetical protein
MVSHRQRTFPMARARSWVGDPWKSVPVYERHSEPRGGTCRTMSANPAKPTASLTSATSPSADWVENSGPRAMNFIAGLAILFRPSGRSGSKNSKPSSEVALFFICAKHRGHMGRQSQAPKQVWGAVALHAVCQERHVVVAEPSTHVVWTGPLPTRPFP